MNNVKASLLSLAKNGYFWGGLILLAFLVAGLALLVNGVLMPAYTRHGARVEVPEVTDQPFETAAQTLEQRGLDVERQTRRFNPDLPRDVVTDQSPRANTRVKPGRRVYLVVNSGRTPMVTIPSLKDASLREARNRLRAIGLKVDEERPDPIPSPYKNTVTRQEPEPGDSLKEGSGVTLWYSTGFGEQDVVVPDVTGLPLDSAEQTLLQQKLRTVNVGLSDFELEDTIVTRQRPAPEASVREGTEIRLFFDPADLDTTDVEIGPEGF